MAGPSHPPIPSRKGRGALSNPEGRFETKRVEVINDGWSHEDAGELPPLPTTVTAEHAKSILTRNDSPDIGFEVSINPYRGCEHGCVYCLSGDTAILLAEGGERALSELRVGDEICGTEPVGSGRRYVKTLVLAQWKTNKPAFRVTLADGTSLVASGDHRFLTARGWVFVHAGSGSQRPHLAVGDSLLGYGSAHRGRSLLGETLSTRHELRVVELESTRRKQDLFDITTGTGDFIANGVVSHNCYARPMHSYVNLSPGLDFETRLFYKAGAAELLERELRKRTYVCKPINLGAATDPYQPIERKLQVTRSILEVLQRFRNPLTLVTKSSLVERDLDILGEMAGQNLVNVYVSITTLDAGLKRTLEPRAPSPAARLQAVRRLREAGIPVGVLVAPIIPAVNDAELERIVAACAQAGAGTVGYVLLRLPYEVKDLFREWLETHMPLRAAHVMSLIQSMRGGQDNDPRFGSRMRGEGPFADLLRTRFAAACKRHGLARSREASLSTDHFRVPGAVSETSGQLSLL